MTKSKSFPRHFVTPAVTGFVLALSPLMPPAAICAETVAGTQSSQTPRQDFIKAPVEMAESGIYCPSGHVGTAPAPGTESGYILLMSGNADVAVRSHVVPAALGLSFGVNIRLAADAEPGDYLMVVLHPPYGERQIIRESWNPNLSHDWGVRSFQFEYEHEMQLGSWSFEVHRGDEILMRQTFEVVPPRQAPEAIDVCFGAELLS